MGPMKRRVNPEEEDQNQDPLGLPGFSLTQAQPDQMDTPEDPLGLPGFSLIESVPQEDPLGLPGFSMVQPEAPKSTVDELLAEYPKGITQDTIVNDPRLLKFIDEDLLARGGGDTGGLLSGAVDLATGVAGGATVSNTSGLSPKERVEMWQNQQRSFAGGQTVTTARELARTATATQEDLDRLGAGYKIFDSMQNAFTGDDVTWGDTLDATRDYLTAAVWDPTTLLGLGVGRIATGVAAKATGRELVNLAARVTAKTLAEQMANGVPRKVAMDIAKKAAADATAAALTRPLAKGGGRLLAATGATDLISAIGTDIAYQNVMIDTDVQENYSGLQTGLAALGGIALPATITAVKGISSAAKAATKGGALSSAFEPYMKIMRQGPQQPATITNLSRAGTNVDEVNAAVKRLAVSIPSNWQVAVKEATKATDGTEIGLSDKLVREDFWQPFLFGDADNNGFVQQLYESGLRWVPRTPDDKVSNLIGDALGWLDDSAAQAIKKSFEDTTGVKLEFGDTAESLMNAYKARASLSGTVLSEGSVAYKILNEGDMNFAPGATLKAEKATEADLTGYAQSVWKRLVTSHLGTTGLNIKGWAATYAGGAMSDMVLGLLNTTAIAPYKLLRGDKEGAKLAAKQFSQSVLGSMRRGSILIDPNAGREAVDQLFDLNPKLEKELFREIAGDSGAEDAVSRFGINPANGIARGVEATVNTAQAAAGVKLQDEVTKQISFITAYDTMLRREYGQSFNEFMSRPDAFEIMATPTFREKVEGRALDRALRETYSKTWSNTPGKNVSLNLAKFVEKMSSDSTLGYFLPFGKFFNTSIATLGDYTMINAGRHALKKVFKDPVSFSHESGSELFAKGLTGLTAIGVLAYHSRDNLEEGLAWNQVRDSDGSIKDVTYDFPESFFRMMGQWGAHLARDGEAPKELVEEIIKTTFGQTFRATEDTAKSLSDLSKVFLAGDLDEASKASLKFFMSGVGKIVSGYTRPLDSINTGAMMLTEDYEVADRRQGAAWWNETTRYVDNIFSEDFLYGGPREKRHYPTKPGAVPQDPGKVLGGNRTVAEPTSIERMMNSIGMPSWQAAQWDGPPEVKNRLDEIIAPILTLEADRVLRREPDFMDKPLAYRQAAVKDILARAKVEAKDRLENSYGDPTYKILMDLSSTEKKATLKRAMKKMGLEGVTLEELTKYPDAEEKLKVLQYYVDNYEELFTDAPKY